MNDASLPFEMPTPKYPRDFGGYLLLKPIAQGGMGAVHLAKQGGGTERECVVKTLRSIHTDSPEHLRRFLDEARVVQRLEHRNICRTSDVGVVGSTPYLVMDWVSGRDVRAVQGAMADNSRVKVQTHSFALHVVQRVLRALEYANQLEDERTLEQLRIVHRDVSPQNVMVSFGGEVKLIDFGLAASTMKTEHTARGSIMGKLAYMAPEQLREEPLDGRCDLFACGVMLYELFCSERYYSGLTQDEMWECVAYGGHTPAQLPTLPEPMRVVVEKACAHRKEDRYKTCGEFAKVLTGLAESASNRIDRDQIAKMMERLFPHGDREEAALLKNHSAHHLSAASATAHLPKPGGASLDLDLPEPEGEATEWVAGLDKQVETLHAKLSAPGADAEKLLGEMSAPNELARGKAKDRKLLMVGLVLVGLSLFGLSLLGVLLVWAL